MAAAWFLAMATAGAARADTLESVVKAAYLYKFAPFVDWPSSAFTSPTSPFRLCILGADPFGATLDSAVNGHQVGDHPVEVRRLQAADPPAGCHIVYFGGGRNAALTAAFNRLRGSPVLTVTEAEGGPTGGIIAFVMRDGHVRFAIDQEAAAANRVKISSKLLGLAVAVRSAP